MKSKILLGMGIAGCLMMTSWAADEGVAEHDLSEFKLGEHVSGNEVDLSKQDGKVVVIEYWGTR